MTLDNAFSLKENVIFHRHVKLPEGRLFGGPWLYLSLLFQPLHDLLFAPTVSTLCNKTLEDDCNLRVVF